MSIYVNFTGKMCDGHDVYFDLTFSFHIFFKQFVSLIANEIKKLSCVYFIPLYGGRERQACKLRDGKGWIINQVLFHSN